MIDEKAQELGRLIGQASEYQALSDLPGITDARVFEPMPEDVHSWTR